MDTGLQEPMTVSEAQVLYLYHARASFFISMQGFTTHQDRENWKIHDERAEHYSRRLREVGVRIEDIHGDVASQLATAHTRFWAVLYAERQQLKGGVDV